MKTNKLLIFQYAQNAQDSEIAVFTHVIHARKFSARSPNKAQIVECEVVVEVNFRLVPSIRIWSRSGHKCDSSGVRLIEWSRIYSRASACLTRHSWFGVTLPEAGLV